MKNNRWWGRVIAAATILALAGGGGVAFVLADSTGPATPSKATAAHSQNRHIVPMAPSDAVASASGRSTAARLAVPSRIQAVQLSATQLPAGAAQKWTPDGKPNTRSIAGHNIRENECASVHGAMTWVQQGFSSDSGTAAAVQDTFAFDSSAEAQTAYQAMVTGMARCQAVSRASQSANHTPADAVVARTAGLAHAVAWERRWTGVLGMSAAGPQTNHFYFAIGGSVVLVLQFTEFPGYAALYNTAGDPQVLAMLDAKLTR